MKAFIMAKRIQVRLIMQLHADGMSQDDIATTRIMMFLHCRKLSEWL